jgi:hypothetical protein
LTSPQQPLIGDEGTAGAAGLGRNSRRGHCGAPPNRTDRSSAS